MKKPTIKTSFWTLQDADFNMKARVICYSMKDNEYFPAPIPSIGTVSMVSEQYNAALTDSRDGGRVPVSIKKALRKQLTDLLMQLANYVKTVATDEAMLVSSGYNMANDGLTSVITKPRYTRLMDGRNEGELISKCAIVKGARGYSHQYTLDPVTAESVWTERFSTRSKYTFKNLQSKSKFWSRIKVIGSNNQEIISDAAYRVVQ